MTSGLLKSDLNWEEATRDLQDWFIPEKAPEPENLAKRVWARTLGVATVYVKKPVLPPLSSYKNLFVRRKTNPEALQYQNERGAAGYMNQQTAEQIAERRRVEDNAFSGAEVRIVRRLQLFKPSESEPSRLDFGVGLRFGINEKRLQPVARVRLGKFLTLKGLPEPTIKISHAIPLRFQGMQAHIRYEVPIPALMESVDALWKQPARMLIRFEHGANSGVHFYPGGFEFGDHAIELGSNGTTLRAAAGVSFPRELPYHPDKGGDIDIRRLGIKAIW